MYSYYSAGYGVLGRLLEVLRQMPYAGRSASTSSPFPPTRHWPLGCYWPRLTHLGRGPAAVTVVGCDAVLQPGRRQPTGHVGSRISRISRIQSRRRHGTGRHRGLVAPKYAGDARVGSIIRPQSVLRAGRNLAGCCPTGRRWSSSAFTRSVSPLCSGWCPRRPRSRC